MKKGMVLAGFKDLPLKELLEEYKKAGFDGIEVVMREKEGWLGLETTEEEAIQLRKAVEDAGLEVHSVMGGLLWQYRLSDPDPKVRDKGMMVVERGLERARWLGASALLVVPGVVNEETSYEEAYERSFAAIRQLASKAEQEQVSIAVENVWNKLFVSPLEVRDFLDKVDSEYVGWFFDVGNVVLFGFPEQWIDILGHRIKKVHFKDFEMDHRTRTYAWPQLMDGAVNWPKVMAALRRAGYDDYVISEVGGDRKVFAETLRRMDRILAL